MNLTLLAFRFRWLQFPVGFLVLLLQRSPVLRILAEHEQLLTERAPAILRSVFAVAALGACDTLAGATVFSVTATPTAATPTSGAANATFAISGTSGVAESVTFAVTGAPSTPRSWKVTGTLPTGLSVQGGNPVNVSAPYSMRITGTPTAAGSFPVTVTAYSATGATGDSGKITVNFTITAGSGNVAPSFATQPVSQSVTVGGSVTFTVVASGTPAPTLQWRKNGADITSATSSSLTLTNVVASDAATYTCYATNTAGSTTSSGATLTVSKATPALTWSAPAAITYGTALSTSQLDASSGGVAGSFAYSPAAGAVLNAGAGQTLSVTFTPTDTANYNTATASTTITVNKATPSLTWSAPSAITYGTALSATQLNASSGGVAGSLVYNPAAGAVLNAGSGQSLGVTFTPTDTANYNTATASTTITVNKATPTLTWPTPASITVGAALGATQLNATASVAGTFVYNPVSGTVLAAGDNQTLGVTFTPTDTVNYNTASTTTTLTVTNKLSPTLTWSAPAAITYGTALGSTQLSATASVAGTFAYSPVSGTVLNAGSQTLSVTFTPADTATYASASATTTLTVSKATPILTWTAPASITYGTALGATQLNATASVAGSFAYDPAAGTVLAVGTRALGVAFTPTDTANYNSATATQSLTVVPAGYLSNLSVRAAYTAGQTLIVGFVVEGGAKPVLVRAAGPILNTYGLSGVTDPTLSLYSNVAGFITSNNDWPSSLAATFTALGAFDFQSGSKDAALLQSVSGAHTAQASGADSGQMLVEAYDAGPNDGRQLTNLSARFQVGSGDNILIAGFVLAGSGTRQLVVRAVGPTLASYGVPNTLADPQLTVFDGGAALAANNDWDAALSPTFTGIGAFALNSGSKDAAALVTLQAGKAYTVQVSGVANTTGEALVELYLVP